MIENTKQIKILDIDNLPTYLEKRNCYSELIDFANSDNGKKGQICALYGLRRTGKTVLSYQLAKELKQKGYKTLYLSCSDELANINQDLKNNEKHTPEITELFNILDSAIKEKYEYVFIDEVTFIKDFVGQGNVLANYYSNQGLSIIVTGTDSLSFALESYDDMYDRIKMVHTSYVPFEEYNRLLGKDIDEYIEQGGTLAKESPFKEGSKRIEYTNTAIVNNIIHSISNSEYKNKNAITLFYEEDDIRTVIQRCINQMNQKFLAKAITKNNGIYESAPLHTGLSNMSKYPYATHLDIPEIDKQIKIILDVLNKDEMKTQFKQEDVDVIRDSLKELDLILTMPQYELVNGELSQKEELQIICQAGMIYCHAKELLNILVNDKNWINLEKCGLERKNEFISRIDNQVKGDILENLILYDTFQALSDQYYVTKINTRIKNRDKEIDVAIIDKKNLDTYLFEVKYSSEIAENQHQHLSSPEFLDYISDNFGQIKGRFVIYNGKTDIVTDELSSYFGNIDYIPASNYLKEVTHCSNIMELINSFNQKHIDYVPPKPTSGLGQVPDSIVGAIQKKKQNIKGLKSSVEEIITEEKERVQYSFESGR